MKSKGLVHNDLTPRDNRIWSVKVMPSWEISIFKDALAKPKKKAKKKTKKKKK